MKTHLITAIALALAFHASDARASYRWDANMASLKKANDSTLQAYLTLNASGSFPTYYLAVVGDYYTCRTARTGGSSTHR